MSFDKPSTSNPILVRWEGLPDNVTVRVYIGEKYNIVDYMSICSLSDAIKTLESVPNTSQGRDDVIEFLTYQKNFLEKRSI